MSKGKGRPGALIIGGSFHSLGAARNLAKHGVPVTIVDRGVCVSRFSRYVSDFIKSPPLDDENRFVEFLLALAAQRDLDGCVLFPSTDDGVRIVSQHWQRLSECYRSTVPRWETVQHLYDKRLTHHLARESGVPIPGTANPRSVDELDSLELDFPLVIKPAVSKQFLAATKKKAYRANDREQLIELYKKTAEIMDPSGILVQELIPGGTQSLYSYGGFFKDGLPVAGFSARRLRQHPMEFGRASTYVETVDLPELAGMATQLLSAIGFSGLAEVEFMYDRKDGRFEFLEVNPRIWGWHSIAIRAGLDLPYLAYRDAIGEEVQPPGPAREGVKWVRLVTDTPTVVSEMRAGRLSMREYVSSMSGDIEFAVFSLRDPLPFVADIVLTPYNYLWNRGF